MRNRNSKARAWALTGLILLLAAAIAVSQHVKRGSAATIQADRLQYDWETGDSEMSGNCRVDIKGEYEATMTASSVLVKTDIEKAQVLFFEARGPVDFDILTMPANGKRSRIQARCSNSATFSEQTMLVVMKGDVHAEIDGVPKVETVQSAVYDGDSMTIDLENHTIDLVPAHLNIEMAPAAAEEAEGSE